MVQRLFIKQAAFSALEDYCLTESLVCGASVNRQYLVLMKIRLGQLRQIIREEYLHGVPEWQFREDTREFVDKIRDRVMNYVLINKSDNALDRQDAIKAMNDVCDQLEIKVYEALEDKLYSFMLQV